MVSGYVSHRTYNDNTATATWTGIQATMVTCHIVTYNDNTATATWTGTQHTANTNVLPEVKAKYTKLLNVIYIFRLQC